ncbi:MAG: protein translocase subunit SecD, partial [Enterobacteriaceae bacterium]
MLNRYPLWKYIMLICVLLFGALYALPNLYGEDPAVQITGVRGIAATEKTLDEVNAILKTNNIASKSVALSEGSILVRFTSTDVQLNAREV